MQAYLRQSVINLIRDEVRRIGRHPAPVELPEELTSDATSPLEAAIQGESYDRYRAALARLKPRDREMVVARVEVQWGLSEIAQRFGYAERGRRTDGGEPRAQAPVTKSHGVALTAGGATARYRMIRA